MTILGKHTVHELDDLVNALSYEVSQTQKASAACAACVSASFLLAPWPRPSS